jgi:hypothetical protein
MLAEDIERGWSVISFTTPTAKKVSGPFSVNSTVVKLQRKWAHEDGEWDNTLSLHSYMEVPERTAFLLEEDQEYEYNLPIFLISLLEFLGSPLALLLLHPEVQRLALESSMKINESLKKYEINIPCQKASSIPLQSKNGDQTQ